MRAIVRAMLAAAIAVSAGPAWSQAKEVRVAMIAPMSGPWARQGELMKKGADMAIEDINRAGGIKALGGARLRLLVVDAGDSAEKAKNAAQRLVAQETDVVGATGAWLSSFTLAVTEVTERAELPVLTLSYSDVITGRGYKYVFQTSPTGGPDDKLVLEKLSEMGLGRGRLPVVSNGAHIGAPEMLKLVGKDLMEGVMTVVANWGAKGQEKLIAEFKQRTGEPWMTQDSISTYGDMWIFKDALEKAGAADKKKVAEAIRAMDTTEGPARFFP